MMKILYVEDDKLYINLVKLILNKNFNIEICNNGIEAVSKILNNGTEYYLVIMDIILPNMNGILAAKNIKNFYPNMPIIALTSRDIDDIKKYKFF